MTERVDAHEDSIAAVKQQLQAGLDRASIEGREKPRTADTPESIRRLAERQHLNELKFSSSLPVVGSVLSSVRELWNSISTKWYVRHIVQQQSDFNAAVVHSVQDLETTLESIRQEIKYLEESSVEVDRYLTRMNVLLSSMSLYLHRLEGERRTLEAYAFDDRLKRLERKVSNLSSADRLTTNDAVGGLTPLANGYKMDSLAFSQRFRGHVDRIKEQQRAYLEYFVDTDDVLDIGCGRGEFLDLLKEVGISAIGVDLDQEMVQYCQEHGLDAIYGDAIGYLSSLPDSSLGGIFSAQVIEHLPPRVLISLVNLSYDKLRPGGVFLAETNNPTCLLAMSTHFTIDLTHERPIHPETIKFLMESAGFAGVMIRYTSPVPDDLRLHTLRSAELGQEATSQWVTTIDSNLEKLNNLLFGYQDYAVIGRKQK